MKQFKQMQDLINEKNEKIIQLTKLLEKKDNLLGILKLNYKFIKEMSKEYLSVDIGNGYSSGIFTDTEKTRFEHQYIQRLYKVGNHFKEVGV
mmetsp:Transcript_20177/g.19130  ORF Transcript_20177/g.19130 Transcript_20177/m.19130 type:complete len:92 (+) Transcript_20177:157-432(+)|eukprot:CAMPEP_0170552612 /NCGR_PEP_ID=MMETSP0211-20121228/10485_1 /TAXON_ID=311385 /ORGANISM="Pseudokeronopsis sp., Strain OXSARD2" /LENGTH=91 /DNA_ID=CAMNT_0010860435 /DNA_START=156 /DNA_END=431 /DNA_ORIENTATION=+